MDIENKRSNMQKLERKVACVTGIVGIAGWVLASYAGASGLVSPEVGAGGVYTGIALTVLGIVAILHSKRTKKH